VRGRSHRLRCRLLVPLTGFLLLLITPGPGPAQAPGLGALRERSATLASESRQAVVELYGLDSQLADARVRLAGLDAHAAELARRQASARNQYRAARRTLSSAQRLLGNQLRVLYQQDQPDAIAVVLGAASLDEAIDGLESLDRATQTTEAVVGEARAARSRLDRTRQTLAAEVSRTLATRAQAVATAVELGRAKAAKDAYLSRLRGEQALTRRQISLLEQRAQEARQNAARITAHAAGPSTRAPAAASEEAPAAAPSEPPPPPAESVSGGEAASPEAAPAPPRPGGTISVQVTGYCLRGSTATGLPVAPGIVAVDPAVIPLGTRMTIPGYGEGVAADVGGAIKGARIDVWYASCAQAAGFTRAVTITFH
jgi:3D (Asp-Asp-Asp) domain-containing protein/peptidoglycan hydrolase CwlO-like protein